MPLDEYAQQVSLNVTDKVLTPQEIQNKYGLKNLPPIFDIGQGRFLSILAIEIDRELTPVEYFTLVGGIKTQLHEINPTVQMLAANEIPVFPDKQVDLHTTAHMRVEDVPPVVEPETEPEEE